MDRRQRKSREAIFRAFNTLLERKHFNAITVQEIIDEADVGRSTFYAHFDTKDALLREMCTEIFQHVFSHELESEQSHDFSHGNQSLQEKLTHLLYHLKDNKGNILGILAGDSSDIFMRYFKEYLREIFVKYPESIPANVPEDYALNHLIVSFAETVRWWIQHKMKESPEEIAENYLKIVAYHEKKL